jgi:hypothetical protein
MLLIYRVIYGASSALILVVVVMEVIRYSGVVAIPQILLFYMFASSAAFELLAIFLFLRVSVLLLWIGTVLFCGFFAWYGWWSLPAPFVHHEIHTFDPSAALHERHMHNLMAGCIFAALCFWFLSLPIVRSRMAQQE